MDFSPGSMAERRVAIPYQHYVPRFQVVTAVWSSTLGLIAATVGIVLILVLWQGHEATGVASEINTILAACGIVMKGSIGSILGAAKVGKRRAARHGLHPNTWL